MIRLSHVLAPLWVAPLLAAQGFVDRTLELGIDHEVATGFDRINTTAVNDWIQRGLALGDISGDGFADIVAVGGVLPNTVLINGPGGFVDATALAGIEVGELDTSPCLADYDDDGDLDLYIATNGGGSLIPVTGTGRLYRNNGAGKFLEVSELAGTRGGGHSIFAQWADLDLDGLSDLLVSEFYGKRNLVYRNNGDGTFTELGSALGFTTEAFTHVTAVQDVDGDALPDVLVGNDYVIAQWVVSPVNSPDQHFAAQADGTWLDVSAGSGYDHMRGIMGLALGDVNYDGWLDVYKADLGANPLSLNQGWPTGSPWLGDEQFGYGVEAENVPTLADPKVTGTAVAWGVAFADFDFDLWLDLIVVNGMIPGVHVGVEFSPRNQRNFLFTGNGPGAGHTFTDATEALGIYDQIDDRALALGDMDQDGDVDVFIQATVGKLRYFENQIDPAGQGWLTVRPECETSAAGGFGVIARFTDSFGLPHVRQIGLDGPTASQHENIARFGLGAEPFVDLEVEFPSGVVLSFPGTPPNVEVRPVEPNLIELGARTHPIAANPGKPGGTQAPGVTTPNLFPVTAFAHAQDGTPLDGSALVTIEVPGLTPLSDVIHIADNEFRRYFSVPAQPGQRRVEVSFDGWTCRVRPRVHFYDPNDTSGTTFDVRPQAVRAGSADTFNVFLAPKTADGISVGPGDNVSVSMDGIQPIAGPVDFGDGRYWARFAAPARSGVYPIDVSINGFPLDLPELVVEAGGLADPGMSSFEVHVPGAKTSAAPHQLKVRYLPKDADGNRIGPFADVEFVATPDPESDPAFVRDDLFPAGQRDGDYLFIVEKPQTEPPTSVAGTLTLTVDGVVVLTTPYAF